MVTLITYVLKDASGKCGVHKHEQIRVTCFNDVVIYFIIFKNDTLGHEKQLSKIGHGCKCIMQLKTMVQCELFSFCLLFTWMF